MFFTSNFTVFLQIPQRYPLICFLHLLQQVLMHIGSHEGSSQHLDLTLFGVDSCPLQISLHIYDNARSRYPCVLPFSHHIVDRGDIYVVSPQCFAIVIVIEHRIVLETVRKVPLFSFFSPCLFPYTFV